MKRTANCVVYYYIKDNKGIIQCGLDSIWCFSHPAFFQLKSSKSSNASIGLCIKTSGSGQGYLVTLRNVPCIPFLRSTLEAYGMRVWSMQWFARPSIEHSRQCFILSVFIMCPFDYFGEIEDLDGLSGARIQPYTWTWGTRRTLWLRAALLP